MNPLEALEFIRKEGIVLESGKSPLENLADLITGEKLKRSWWAHPKSEEIFLISRYIRNHNDILVCRLIQGKITFVHKRLWPPIIRLIEKLDKSRLSAINEMHTAKGYHEVKLIPFDEWVSFSMRESAMKLTDDEAISHLGHFWQVIIK